MTSFKMDMAKVTWIVPAVIAALVVFAGSMRVVMVSDSLPQQIAGAMASCWR
jgi:hypothetical protein